MDLCDKTSKIIIGILTFLFWVIAGCIFYVASMLLHRYVYFDIIGIHYGVVPALVLIAVGVTLFVTSLMGCVGTLHARKSFLATYLSLLIVLFIVILVAGILAFAYRSTAKYADVIDDMLGTEMQNYNDSKSSLNDLQSSFHCCGKGSYADWEDTFWGSRHPGYVPSSCCNSTNPSNTCSMDSLFIFTKGCTSVLEHAVYKFLKIFSWVDIGVSVYLFFAILSCFVVLCRKDRVPYVHLEISAPDSIPEE